MKTKLFAALLAVFLVLTACAAPAPESDSAPPEPESVSDPEPEVEDVSHYYIEDPEKEGIEDKTAVEALYWYLWGNLSPKDYGSVNIYQEYKDDTHEDFLYSLDIYGPNKAPIEALLRDYDGLYAPIRFHQMEKTLLDLRRAEEDMKTFLKEHPEIEVVFNTTGEWEIMCNSITVMEITDELTAFVDNYPIKDIFEVTEYRYERPEIIYYTPETPIPD